MRETEQSVKETGRSRRLKEKAAADCDFQLEGIQQLSLTNQQVCLKHIDQTISMFSVQLTDPYVYFKV